ncbi:protein of unknown function UPF0118 [Olsenella uli DSM 7084]|uniref:Permease n=1 Tax=Olsenella uli (strain ATCC 49627 / DSM 7084 / CCUG 31166 / CIP 109912 / JCM 12494 / LMG 11480 / NCIMB 702895 / VPI D76D-27C) TaxID=633147 RepID=E1QYU5_OLSUV|nr:AI-2E family transporter [Olsenella uli]ADK67559.1 protein of unknown function UPF0118 [Olsenella uli DSM 7084]KRO13656.1 hypothetical protein IV77_GL001118 [Olsenella uli DSM 7084]
MRRFRLDDDRYSTISRYVVATAAAIVAIVLAAVHLAEIADAVGTSLAWVYAIVSPLIVGGLAAILLYPGVKWFARRLGRVPLLSGREKLRHVLGVLLVCVCFVLALSVLVALLLSVITGSIHRIRFENLESLAQYLAYGADGLYRWLIRLTTSLGVPPDDVNAALEHAETFVFGDGDGLGQTLTKGVTAVRNAASTMVFAAIFAVYLMVDAPHLASYWNGVLRSLMGERGYGRFAEFRADVVFAFTGYMRGQFIDAVLVGLMVGVSLTVVGVDFAPVIGIATGIGNLIPYIGPIVSYVLTVAVCVVNGDIGRLVVAAAVLLVIQFVDGQVINPKILSDSVEVHPILVLVALTAGGRLGGVLGMFIAVPCAALAKIYFEKFVAWRRRMRVGGGGGTGADAGTSGDGGTGADAHERGGGTASCEDTSTAVDIKGDVP